MKKTGTLIWLFLLALAVTIAFAVYQRKTGPTHPKEVTLKIEGIQHAFMLSRSTEIVEEQHRKKGEEIIHVEVDSSLRGITGEVFYRKYPPAKAKDGQYTAYSVMSLQKTGNTLWANLPNQAMAGKLQYYIRLYNVENGNSYDIGVDDPVIIRYKGVVPVGILIPHIFSMFTSLIMALMSLLAIICFRNEKKYPILFGLLSFFFLTLGGLILGLFVQKFAFGVYWAGFPFAWDLTDNKTLMAFLIWLIALLLNIKKYRPVYLVIAVLAMFVIFSIPHSLNGSERNPQTGEVEYR